MGNHNSPIQAGPLVTHRPSRNEGWAAPPGKEPRLAEVLAEDKEMQNEEKKVVKTPATAV